MSEETVIALIDARVRRSGKYLYVMVPPQILQELMVYKLVHADPEKLVFEKSMRRGLSLGKIGNRGVVRVNEKIVNVPDGLEKFIMFITKEKDRVTLWLS